ncbi:MAG: hypothetical protein M3123_05795 [Actinomycetota bacterium]|nr:hypothetical protein [Actinomycetota bacterium]
MHRFVLALALFVATALAVPAAYAGPIIDRAVQELANDPVYVDPSAELAISDADATELRERISEAGAGPMYIAILPEGATSEAGGDPDEVLRDVARGVAENGTYALVVGNRFRAASNLLEAGEAGRLATEALEENRGEGVPATLLAFVDRVGAARQGEGGRGEGADDGDGAGAGLLVLPLLAAGGAGFFLYRRFRRRREEDAELAEVKDAAQEDLLALAEDIRALDLDVEMPGAHEEARREYERALSMYERADRALDRARSPEDLEEVSSSIEEGRFAIAATRARLEGKEPPDRRPPCFFDPRHGPSTREVEWAPSWGTARLVPACEADAQRVEQGLEPATREVLVHGERVPYWNAPPAYYGPWAGGYFGGFGGLFPGLLIGSMLGGAFAPPVFIDAGGDGGGGGDFGGGDFGGGDFGGGDFGGGGGEF